MRMNSFAGAAVALAMCMSPTMATAATSAPVQSVNPLMVVSVFGTQASAQEAWGNAATATAAGAAAVAQGQPATDAPPPPPPPPPNEGQRLGISPIILGLLGIAALAALIASSGGDSDSPSSPS